jgi:predicted metal-dependent phosphoesterase TrpH
MQTNRLSAFAVLTFVALVSARAHDPEPVTRARTAIHLPDVPGYVTLKCDFHIHTVFSDGYVWPTVRAEEAWREGLDAIAITDHIEYRPHKKDITADLNRSYNIARETGDDLRVMVIHGSEITRSMPPGHLNAIFLTNSIPLDTKEWPDAIQAANAQGAFVFWNHPGWKPQLKNGVITWHDEHTAMLKAGQLHGIEVVNERNYYPEAHRWAIERKLTLMSNSDIHSPLNMDYHVHIGDHRPLTLVFAKERSIASIREALFARRTAVYSANRLIGEEQFLRPIFEKSVTLDRTTLQLKSREKVLVQVSNASDVSFELELVNKTAEFTAPGELILAARKTVLLELKGNDSIKQSSESSLDYRVKNLLVAPDKSLAISLPIRVSVSSSK